MTGPCKRLVDLTSTFRHLEASDPDHSPTGIHTADFDEVAREIARKLQGANLTLRGGLRESGLFNHVDQLYRSGASWESIGQSIGWSPINARECFVLEGGTL